MSYGSSSGEVYLSDATLAFLEDTGQYIANYSMAGRLADFTTAPVGAGCDVRQSGTLDFLLGQSRVVPNAGSNGMAVMIPLACMCNVDGDVHTDGDVNERCCVIV
jgi:hypothetical protein